MSESANAAGARVRRPDMLVLNGSVLTMNPARQQFSAGYVAVRDDRIIDVGPMPACPYTEAERVIDAAGKAVLPGFINAHTHAIHILMRGGLSDDRSLYDWLFNVVLPFSFRLAQSHRR
jgi:cytosine/adenosine deaminase-related metal-dependent hydrolase